MSKHICPLSLMRLAALTVALTCIQVWPIAAKDTKHLDEQLTRVNELARGAKYQDALHLADDAAREAATDFSEKSTEYARAIGWQAYLLQVLGQFREARPKFEQSLAIYQELLPPGHSDIATATNNLAFHYQVSDRLPEAEALYKTALLMRENLKPPDDGLVADSLNNLAQVYKHEGRVREALPLLERSLSLRLKLLKPNDPLIAQSLTNIGSALDRLGQFKKSEPYLRKALEIRRQRQAPDHPDVAGAMNRLAQNLSSQGEFAEADRLFSEATATRGKSLPEDDPDVANMLHDSAQNLYLMERYPEAEERLLRAIAIRRKILPENHPTIAHALSDLASVQLAQNRPTEAMQTIREGVRMLLARGKLDDLGRTRFLEFVHIAWRARGKGKGLQDASLADEAFVHAQWAADTPTSDAVARMSARFAATDPALKALIDESEDLDGEQERLEVALSSALAQPAKQRVGVVERLRAEIASTIEKRRTTDEKIRLAFPRFFELVNPAPLDIVGVQALLRPNEVLLDYVTAADDEVHLWAITKTEAQWHRLDIKASEVAADVARLRNTLDPQAIAKAGASAQLFELGVAHDLYVALLQPVAALMPEGKELVVVANGAMSSLPIQMLVEKEPSVPRPTLAQMSAYRDADWVARHHAVSVLPSVTSLKSIRSDAGHTLAKAPLIGFGNPLLAASGGAQGAIKASSKTTADDINAPGYWRGPAADLDAVRSGLAPLPETEGELRTIAHDLKAEDSDLMLGPAATETAVKHTDLSRYRVVYFATHGLMSGEIPGLGEPALVFSLPAVPTALDDGLLTASEVTQLKLDADWVVLSACNTASGQREGDEAFSGLARAFFHAGTRALLVSHWRVGSAAAAQLTTRAFQKMESDISIGRAEAMRRAMVELADDTSDPWNPYPTFWAPFSVVGEGER